MEYLTSNVNPRWAADDLNNLNYCTQTSTFSAHNQPSSRGFCVSLCIAVFHVFLKGVRERIRKKAQ